MLTKISDELYLDLSKIEMSYFFYKEDGNLGAVLHYMDKEFKLTGDPARALKIALNKHFGETNED